MFVDATEWEKRKRENKVVFMVCFCKCFIEDDKKKKKKSLVEDFFLLLVIFNTQEP